MVHRQGRGEMVHRDKVEVRRSRDNKTRSNVLICPCHKRYRMQLPLTEEPESQIHQRTVYMDVLIGLLIENVNRESERKTKALVCQHNSS